MASDICMMLWFASAVVLVINPRSAALTATMVKMNGAALSLKTVTEA